MANDQKKQVRLKNKEVKKTLKKVGALKCKSQDEIDAKIFNYVKGLNDELRNLTFTDEQLENPQFLLSLYRANLEASAVFSPKENNKNLQLNVDFMIEYVKLRYQRELSKFAPRFNDDYLSWIVVYYKLAIANPQFVAKFAKEFPDIEIVPFVDLCLQRRELFGMGKATQEDIELFKKCMKGLPLEMLCMQAQKYGVTTLKYVPKDIDGFNKIVSAAIEKDGFKALKQLDISQVESNKDLVVKAYEKDGVKMLDKYISYTLSPYRSESLGIESDGKGVTRYDQRFSDVQSALRADPQIAEIFDLAKQLTAEKQVQLASLEKE